MGLPGDDVLAMDTANRELKLAYMNTAR